VLPSLLLCFVLAWPYIFHLLSNRPAWIGNRPQPPGYWFPMTAGRILSAAGLDYFWEGDWLALSGWKATLFRIAQAMTSLSYCWVWVGILLGAFSLVRSLRSRTLLVADRLTAVCLMILVAQCLLDGATGTFFHPHYFNGTWIAYVFLAWLAVGAMASKGWAAVSWIQTVSLAGILAFLIIETHVRGGTRGVHYGATLGNQLEVVDKLNSRPDSPVALSVYQYASFPHALTVLRTLYPPTANPERGPISRLQIAYATADPNDGHLAVRELPGP
jgi:hypothetical protein